MSLRKIILSNAWLTHLAIAIHKRSLQRKKQISFSKGSFIGFSVACEGKNGFGRNSSITSSAIGFGSYIADDTIIAKTKIGRYCSIGPKVSCVFGRHPSDTFVSTHPSFFAPKTPVGFSYTEDVLFEEYPKPIDQQANYSISIGNDVWIGANVAILDGVRIGDGAIIAANALVNKDVPAYTIVGGVPAKIIKKRFEQEDIDFLMAFQWWNKPEEWIRSNAHYFKNIKDFKEKVQHGM